MDGIHSHKAWDRKTDRPETSVVSTLQAFFAQRQAAACGPVLGADPWLYNIVLAHTVWSGQGRSPTRQPDKICNANHSCPFRALKQRVQIDYTACVGARPSQFETSPTGKCPVVCSLQVHRDSLPESMGDLLVRGFGVNRHLSTQVVQDIHAFLGCSTQSLENHGLEKNACSLALPSCIQMPPFCV